MQNTDHQIWDEIVRRSCLQKKKEWKVNMFSVILQLEHFELYDTRQRCAEW